jgi:tetratricopeptide (TPR) repeat protein
MLVLPARPDALADRPVAAWTEPVVIPTYPVPPPDRNPLFLEHRVYQGSSGKVYPNPVTDRVSDEPVDQAWEAIHLENRWLRVLVLPAIGGRIHVVMDRTNGYDLVYRQNVIKPALVGLLGPWISGGIELNWPQHHRPSTFMPVDWAIEGSPDGSVTAWCSEHEPMDRMKGMHGVTLHPDSSVLELRVRLVNRTQLRRTFLWWANVAARVHDRYEAFFPPDVTHVADHAKRAMSTFPVARGRYYGIDYGARTPAEADLRWYRNIPVPTSYMAMGTRDDFFGGYDHAADAGFVHWADHAISPGKKLWTWGDHPFGHAWDRELTDADGPYIELMAGVFTDNQPDFSFLAPGETRVFSQYWYPIRDIGPAHRANLDAAVHLHASHGHARLGVAVTRPHAALDVRLHAGRHAILERRVAIGPDAPLVVRDVPIPEGTRAVDLELEVRDGDRVLIRHRPVHPHVGEPPPPAREPALPAAIGSVEELVLVGRHLEQYRHATRRPEDYWREACRRDPGESRANTEMGLWHLRRGEPEAAEAHLRRAVERLTRLNPNPPEGEPLYALGLALRELGRLEEAAEMLGRATWLAGWQGPADLARAELRCAAGDLPGALARLDAALAHDRLLSGARAFRVAVLRRLGRLDEAADELRACLAEDPLDARALAERDRLVAAGVAAERLSLPRIARLPTDAGVALDVAHDDARAGLLPEATALLERALAGAAPEAAPLVAYTLGWLCERAGDREAASGWRARARQLPIERCFPGRREDIDVLRSASAADPADPHAPYLLGLLLYDRGRYREAIACWEASARLDPTFPTVHRNLGLAAFNVLGRPARARGAYRRAFAAGPSDARVLYELDQLRKRLGDAPADRLAALERHRALALSRDDLATELVTLLNLGGRHAEAREVLAGRRFHPWEGGEGLVAGQWVVANRELARAAIASGDLAEALRRLADAQDYPETLGEGKHPLAPENEIGWLLAETYRALGDEAERAAALERAAVRVADPALGPVPADHWRALALRALGREVEADAVLRAMLSAARRARHVPARIDYFATSLPSFLLFADDVERRTRVGALVLEGLALLGLGRRPAARRAFREAAEREPAELEARLRLAELGEGRAGRAR